jgi:hypothetical protein
MNARLRSLGSFNSWAILRLGELAFVAGGLLPLFMQRKQISIALQASTVALLALLTVYFYPFAFGYADDHGIIFCRYFKLHFVPWNEVTRMRGQQRIDFELVVRLARRVGLTNTVKFTMNLTRKEVRAFKNGWKPEIMTWLTDRISSAQAPTPHACSSCRVHPDA